jgi:hypothetical protein
MTDSPHPGLSNSPKQPALERRRLPTRQQTDRKSSNNTFLRAEQHPPARRGPSGPTAASRSASGRSWTPTPRWRLPIQSRRKQEHHPNRPSILDRPRSFRNDTKGCQIRKQGLRGDDRPLHLRFPWLTSINSARVCRRIGRDSPDQRVRPSVGSRGRQRWRCWRRGTYCRVVDMVMFLAPCGCAARNWRPGWRCIARPCRVAGSSGVSGVTWALPTTQARLDRKRSTATHRLFCADARRLRGPVLVS